MINELWLETKAAIEGLASISTELDSVRYVAGDSDLTPTDKVIVVLHSPDPVPVKWKSVDISIIMTLYSSLGASLEYVKEQLRVLFNGRVATTSDAALFRHSGGTKTVFDDKTKMYVTSCEFQVKGLI